LEDPQGLPRFWGTFNIHEHWLEFDATQLKPDDRLYPTLSDQDFRNMMAIGHSELPLLTIDPEAEPSLS
jgi:hypothetical protein